MEFFLRTAKADGEWNFAGNRAWECILRWRDVKSWCGAVEDGLTTDGPRMDMDKHG
jgi:hypothetical protein